MADLAPTLDLSLDAFLAWEADQEQRWERVAGVVRLMAGGTVRHARIALNIATHLRAILRARGCDVLTGDLKVVAPAGDAMYPDVVAVCPPADDVATFTDRPTVVIEVLSERTRKDDDTRKRWAYWSIPSLRYYVLVDQEKPAVEVNRRGADGRWTSDPVERDPAASVRLDELDVTLPLTAIYEGVSFDTA